MPLILLIIGVFFAFIGAGMARRRNRDPLFWGFVCFLSMPVGAVILLAIGNREVTYGSSGQNSSEAPVASGRITYAEATPNDAPTIEQPKKYNIQKWQTLIEIDDEISSAAQEVRHFGRKYEDELAEKYLSLSDKSYLPAIVSKIKEKAFGSGATATLELMANYEADVKRHSGRDPSFGGIVKSVLPYSGSAEIFKGAIKSYLQDGTVILRGPNVTRAFRSEEDADEWGAAQDAQA